MNREEAEKALYYAMTIGERMLTCGAEVGRVEDTIRRICTAYGAKRVDVFSITSSIVTTMIDEEENCYTQTRRVSGSKNDLNKLHELNRLSRKICAQRMPEEEIRQRLEKIEQGKQYSFPVQVAVYALIAASFTLFFGGNGIDMVASAIMGIFLKLLERAIRRFRFSSLFSTFLCATLGGFVANTLVSVGVGQHTDLICIGNIMLLIPGIALTNSLRDLLSGDTITGLVRFCESVLLAIIIALGFNLAGLFF